jgi:hypothetical protein
MTTAHFFAIEQTIRRPNDGGLTYAEGHGTRAHGSLSLTDSGQYTDTQILASDMGYRTRPTDPKGPVPYPPRVLEAFAVDGMVNLDPAASAVGASWGAIQLANSDGFYDSIINGGWIADGRDTHILYGDKLLENFSGTATARATVGTYLDQNNTLQLAPVNVVRQDYTGQIALDVTATNVVRNSVGNGATAGTINSGGVMPTGWSVASGGLAVELSIYKSGAAGAANVLRMRFHGTPTASTGSLSYGTTGSLSGLPNNAAIVQSHSMALIAGSFANVTQIVHWLALYDATATTVTVPQPNFLASITGTLTRLFRTYSTPATGNAAYATSNPSIVFYWNVGAPVDFTIDFTAPQLELGTTPTLFIPTTVGDVTRGDAGTNVIPTSDMTGAVVGTATLPSLWSVQLPGLTMQVTNIGTDTVTHYKYMDLHFTGTTTSAAGVILVADTFTVDATVGQAWCSSIYASLIGGSQSGITFQFGTREWDGTIALLGFTGDGPSPCSLNDITRARRVAPMICSHATTRYAQMTLLINIPNAWFTDFTIRLMAPQQEGGSVATSFMPTTNGPFTRSATYHLTGAPVLLNEIAKNQYVLSTQTPSVGNVNTTVTGEIPPIYGGSSVWKHVRTATGTDSNTATIGVAGLPSTGAALRASIWVWIPGSRAASKTSIAISIEGNTTAATSVAANLALTDHWQRITASATLTSGFSNTSIVLRVTPQVNGDVVYTSCWQMELNTVTSYIPPGTTITLRAADVTYTARHILTEPPYASLVPAFNGVAGPVTSDDKQVTIPLRDTSYWLERPVLRTTYGGNGQYDGTAALTGSLKPLVIGGGQGTLAIYGPVNNITPILVDPPNLIYQVCDGPILKLANLYEGGHAGGWAFAGDVADLYVGSTPAGSYRTCLARGCFQLGSTPVYAITCDVNGQTIPGSPGPVALAVAAYALTNLCGVPANLVALNGTNLAAIGAVAPLASGCAIFLAPGDAPDGITLLTRILAPAGMKLVSCRDGKLRALVLAALPPNASTLVEAALDNRNIISITPIALPAGISPTPYRMRVGYNDNYTQQTTDLSPLIDATRKQYLATPQSIQQSNSPTLFSSVTRPNDPPVITGSIVDAGPTLGALAAAQAAASQYTNLWGVRRRVYGIEVPFALGVTLEYGDVVSVTTEIGDLSGTRLGQVVGYSYRSEDASVTVRLLI